MKAPLFTPEEIKEIELKAEAMRLRQSKKIERERTEGNYARTKLGKQLLGIAKEIQVQTGDIVKAIKIEKSDNSNSIYIIMILADDDYYTIRISDHDRPAYNHGGVWYDHDYDQDIVVSDFDNISWERVIVDAVNSLRNR